MTRRTNYLLLTLLLAGLASMVALLNSPIAALMAVTCVAIAAVVLLRVEWLRNAALMTASIVGALLAAEAVVTINNTQPSAFLEPATYQPTSPYMPDRDLGYRFRANIAVEGIRKTRDKMPVYRVQYTFDTEGRRQTPGGGGDDAEWVFFAGCSFTLGEGLSDKETLPAQYARETAGRYHVVNLGVSGYGVHHFVRMLETGRVAVPQGRRVHAVYYSVMGSHAIRAAGLPPYSRVAPKYILDDDGGVRYVGSFEDDERWELPFIWLRNAFRKLRVGAMLLDRINGESYERLNNALLRRAGQLVREKFGVDLVVVVWFGTSIGDIGLPTLAVGDLLPGQQGEFMLPWDGHPGPAANRLIAKALYLQFESNGR